jgi:hypothetical protein
MALGILSLGALGLAVIVLLVEGVHWQLVPWQLLTIACAAGAGLRRWSPGHSRGWRRVLGRLGLLAGVLIGGVGLLFVRVPSLPQTAGPYQVGSQVFRWTDFAAGGDIQRGRGGPTRGRGPSVVPSRQSSG